MEKYVKHNKLIITGLLLPAIIFFTVFVVSTVVANVGLSFTNWDGVKQIKFIGLKNWIKLIGDEDYWTSFKNTWIIFAGIFCIMIPSAFLIATILAKKMPGTKFFQFVFFAPIVISGIMIGLIWNFVLDPSTGLLNSILRAVGLDSMALEWIGGRVLSPYSMAFICIWQWLGINVVIFLTGIKAIPSSIYESAVIDGSKSFHTTMTITLPLIKESLVSSAILNIGGVFKVYELVTSLTNGGPGYSSCTLASYMMIKMFDAGKYGYGATIATSILLITSLLSIVLYSINRKFETYQM